MMGPQISSRQPECHPAGKSRKEQWKSDESQTIMRRSRSHRGIRFHRGGSREESHDDPPERRGHGFEKGLLEDAVDKKVENPDGQSTTRDIE